MAEETHEIEKSVEQKGTVKFNLDQTGNPTPAKWKRVSTALRYSFVGMITMISGSDLFNGYQSKIISFTLGVCILITGAIDLFMGVEPPTKN